jgi:hypothetical protein
VIPNAKAQFGVAQKRDAEKVQALLEQQQQPTNDNSNLVTMLLQVANQDEEILQEQDAVDLAVLLEQASKDTETREMIARMRIEEKDTLAQLKATASVKEVMLGLVQVVEEMKMLEVVFADPQRALELMLDEGMIESSHKAKYKQNPALLEDDTRKGLYFTFCTLAVTAGFL